MGSTKSFFEKSEFVKALAEARVDGVEKSQSGGSTDEEGYAEYSNVEVLTSDDAGPRKKVEEPQSTGNPFGGGGGSAGGSPFGGGANPFGGDMGGMGGMGGYGRNSRYAKKHGCWRRWSRCGRWKSVWRNGWHGWHGRNGRCNGQSATNDAKPESARNYGESAIESQNHGCYV